MSNSMKYLANALGVIFFISLGALKNYTDDPTQTGFLYAGLVGTFISAVGGVLLWRFSKKAVEKSEENLAQAEKNGRLIVHWTYTASEWETFNRIICTNSLRETRKMSVIMVFIFVVLLSIFGIATEGLQGFIETHFALGVVVIGLGIGLVFFVFGSWGANSRYKRQSAATPELRIDDGTIKLGNDMFFYTRQHNQVVDATYIYPIQDVRFLYVRLRSTSDRRRITDIYLPVTTRQLTEVELLQKVLQQSQ